MRLVVWVVVMVSFYFCSIFITSNAYKHTTKRDAGKLCSGRIGPSIAHSASLQRPSVSFDLITKCSNTNLVNNVLEIQ